QQDLDHRLFLSVYVGHQSQSDSRLALGVVAFDETGYQKHKYRNQNQAWPDCQHVRQSAALPSWIAPSGVKMRPVSLHQGRTACIRLF
ncbi:MAG: hypothetical protein AAGA50_14290, partial [Pseudomonadota bacterium]